MRKYTGGTASTGPKSASSSSSPTKEDAEKQMESAGLKAEILASLEEDIVVLRQSEFENLSTEEFEAVKSELHAVKAELANNAAIIRSEVDVMKTPLSEMQRGFSSCSDVVTLLQTEVGKLEAERTSLRDINLDMEGRLRRFKIKIDNV